MFKIKADPTFEASITVVGQGREQKLSMTFRHKTRTEYADLVQSVADGKKAIDEVLLELIEKWDADMDLNKDSLKLLHEHQPGSDWAILIGYGEALAVTRKGN